LEGAWGVTIPSIVFNTRINTDVNAIGDGEVRALLEDGGACTHASQAFIRSLSGVTKSEGLNLYVNSLRVTWIYSCCHLMFWITSGDVREMS
jgi:hypothetical protein